MKDIFGQDLVIGNMYIRAHNSNGSTDIKIGELIKINDKTVTLDIQVRASAYREEDVKLTISTYYRARKYVFIAIHYFRLLKVLQLIGFNGNSDNSR